MSRSKIKSHKNGVIVWNKGKKTGSFMTDSDAEKRSKKMSGSGNPMFGKNVKEIIGKERDLERAKKIGVSNRKPKKTKENYEKYASTRRWIVNKEGEIKHSTNDNDSRIISGEWKYGKKWK